MGRILRAVAVCAAIVVVAWWVAHLTGQVEATVASVTVRTSTPVAVLALGIAVIALHLLLRLIWAVLGLPSAIGFWSSRRRRVSGDAAITHALVALAAGDQGDARRETGRARRLLGDSPQTLLLAAEAGRLNNDEAAATELYRTLANRQDGAFLGLRGLFRQAMAREDWGEATALARQAETAHPGGTWLRTERAELAVRTSNWAQALALAGPNAPVSAYAAAAADAETDPDEATTLARQAWKEDQGFTPAAIAYARRLRQAGREKRAQSVIRTAWARAPQPDLATFLLQPTTDRLARLREAKRLVGDTGSNPESRLLLAQLALDAGLTAEARTQIAALRQTGFNQKRLWVLLARIELQERGDTEEGRTAQRDALLNAASASPDPIWRCEACGTEHGIWHPACPVCHTPGRVTWSTAQRLFPGAA